MSKAARKRNIKEAEYIIQRDLRGSRLTLDQVTRTIGDKTNATPNEIHQALSNLQAAGEVCGLGFFGGEYHYQFYDRRTSPVYKTRVLVEVLSNGPYESDLRHLFQEDQDGQVSTYVEELDTCQLVTKDFIAECQKHHTDPEFFGWPWDEEADDALQVD